MPTDYIDVHGLHVGLKLFMAFLLDSSWLPRQWKFIKFSHYYTPQNSLNLKQYSNCKIYVLKPQ